MRKANSPAMGRSASAAIYELSMSVLPAAWSVAPAVSMIAGATRFAERRHADPGIHTNPFEGRRGLLRRLGELLAERLLALVFSFLG